MFAPAGFIPLFDFLTACWTVALDRFPNSPDESEWPDIDPRASLYADLLFDRLIEANRHSIWAFQPPNNLLRMSSSFFWRARSYHGPCPEDLAEAQEVHKHLKAGPFTFVDPHFHIDANWNPKFVEEYGLQKSAEQITPLHNAVLCVKSETSAEDIERLVRPFRDHIYFRDHPGFSTGNAKQSEETGLSLTLRDFREVCPEGKQQSSLTWTEIEKQTGWSRRQILRAIAHESQTKSGH